MALSAGRKDECPKCKSDLHACKNCKFYDSSAYNECLEPQAERVVDKGRSNFCDYFEFRNSAGEAGTADQGLQKADYLKQLDSLFK